MSDRKIAKNRWHRGVSLFVRTRLRKVGIAMDEEAAQFALGGNLELSGYASDLIEQTCSDALNRRHELMQEWEKEHPGRNPYPPSFPERCLKIVRECLEVCSSGEEQPVFELERLRLMCEAELEIEPITTTPVDEE